MAVALLAGCEDSRTYQFALIGDNPYVDFNYPKYDRMIRDINAYPELAWVIHVGDMKGSALECSDDNLVASHEKNLELAPPFVLTPGDNDWFDCKRQSAGGWDRRERLAFIRRSHFPAPGVMDGLPVVSQAQSQDFPEFVENVHWRRGGVVFATIHLVGITGVEGGLDIHGALMDAALAWLDEVFKVARETASRGVFVATQANPYLFTAERSVMDRLCPSCPWVRPGYEALDAALARHAKAFNGPIVLAVGDTHTFRVDKPLYDGGHLVENFTRVETFGHPTVHWVKVVVNPASAGLFEFHQQLVPGNVGHGWADGDRDRDRAKEPQLPR